MVMTTEDDSPKKLTRCPAENVLLFARGGGGRVRRGIGKEDKNHYRVEWEKGSKI